MSDLAIGAPAEPDGPPAAAAGADPASPLAALDPVGERKATAKGLLDGAGGLLHQALAAVYGDLIGPEVGKLTPFEADVMAGALARWSAESIPLAKAIDRGDMWTALMLTGGFAVRTGADVVQAEKARQAAKEAPNGRRIDPSEAGPAPGPGQGAGGPAPGVQGGDAHGDGARPGGPVALRHGRSGAAR